MHLANTEVVSNPANTYNASLQDRNNGKWLTILRRKIRDIDDESARRDEWLSEWDGSHPDLMESHRLAFVLMSPLLPTTGMGKTADPSSQHISISILQSLHAHTNCYVCGLPSSSYHTNSGPKMVNAVIHAS